LKQIQQYKFFERQRLLRQKQIETVRKYRLGELPDIRIFYKDIIDPLIAMSFENEDIAGELFNLLFYELFKEEERQD
jgi:DNA-dependent protein kinase catalytic subunit